MFVILVSKQCNAISYLTPLPVGKFNVSKLHFQLELLQRREESSSLHNQIAPISISLIRL